MPWSWCGERYAAVATAGPRSRRSRRPPAWPGRASAVSCTPTSMGKVLAGRTIPPLPAASGTRGGRPRVPELPEVETIRRDLDAVLAGRRIHRVEAQAGRWIRRHPDPADFVTPLVGATVAEVTRRGKYL